MNASSKHYLQRELERLIASDPAIFEFIQRSTLDGLWYWDLENPEQEWLNPDFWHLLGFDPEEKKHLASEWQDLIHPDDLVTALENFDKHCADPDNPYDQVVRYFHKDGSTKWVRCRGLAIRDANGKAIRMLGAHNDITDLMEAKAELETARQLAEAANYSKSVFLANMSHELRTPLNSIIGFSEAMADELFGSHTSAKYKEYSNIIAQSAKHLHQILGDLLDISQIEAGKLNLNEEWVNLGESTAFCAKVLQEKINAKGIFLRIGDFSNVFLQVDATRFRQALLNPLSNAVRHTPPGGEIEIRLTLLEGLRIDIIDNGEGMTPEDIQKVHAPLGYQANSAYTAQRGTGLGLYITRSIQQAHGGELHVSSDLGHGTCVSLTYPLNRVIQGRRMDMASAFR